MKVNIYTVLNSVHNEDSENELVLTRGENSDTIIIKCKAPMIAVRKDEILKTIKLFEEFDKKGETNE